MDQYFDVHVLYFPLGFANELNFKIGVLCSICIKGLRRSLARHNGSRKNMKKKIFISYSHENEDWKKRVVKHLGVLPDIEIWDDRRIKAGANWLQEIEDALNTAEIAILLVSADFLASEFIREVEIPRLLQRRQQEGLIVFPVILYDCPWKKLPWLSEINARPKDGKPLAKDKDKAYQESKLAAIAEEIFELGVLEKTIPSFSKIPERCFIETDKPEFQSLPEIDPEELARFGDHLKEQSQLTLGEYLFGRLFPGFQDSAPPRGVDLHISASAANLFLLPWHVLSHDHVFLSSLGWSLSLSGPFSSQSRWESCTLPDSPRVLLVVPQPPGELATDAHLEELNDELLARNHTLIAGRNLAVAVSWEEFAERLETFSPQVIYFYGICSVDSGGARKLCMASRKKNMCLDIGPEALAAPIAKMPERPVLVYLNALDSSAGLVDFGLALEGLVPAVISSRYLDSNQIASEQGLKLLTDILTRGALPHRAVATLFGRLDTPRTTAQARWMTPLIFRRYDEWHAKSPETPARKIHDPRWYLKIDRVTQFSTVATQTMQMVREGRPNCQAFVWYGTQGQGVEKFHHRLKVELDEYLLSFNAHVHEVRPEWPQELDRPEIAFQDCLIEAFDTREFPIRGLDDIPGAIRNLTRGASGRQTLVYVRHLPVISPRLINPKSLKRYLKWWDENFIPLLERNQFALLGISFIVKNPSRFQGLILEKERLEDLDLKYTVFRLLDEMERLAARDIVDFFKTHNIRLPIRDRDKIIAQILKKTGGHYEKTVRQLQILVEQSWDLTDEEESTERQVEDEYNY